MCVDLICELKETEYPTIRGFVPHNFEVPGNDLENDLRELFQGRTCVF